MNLDDCGRCGHSNDAHKMWQNLAGQWKRICTECVTCYDYTPGPIDWSVPRDPEAVLPAQEPDQ